MKIRRIPNPFKVDAARPVQRVSVPRWVASIILVALIAFVVAVSYGYFKISDLQNSTNKLSATNKSQIACINNNLAARGGPGYSLTQAQLDWGRAERTFTRAQDDLSKAQAITTAALITTLVAPVSQQATLYKIFFKDFTTSQSQAIITQAALETYLTALDKYVAAISDVKTAQATNPLGKC